MDLTEHERHTAEADAAAKLAQQVTVSVQLTEALTRMRQQRLNQQAAADRAATAAAGAEQATRDAADRVRWSRLLEPQWTATPTSPTADQLRHLGEAWSAAARHAATDPAADRALRRAEQHLSTLAPDQMRRVHADRAAGTDPPTTIGRHADAVAAELRRRHQVPVDATQWTWPTPAAGPQNRQPNAGPHDAEPPNAGPQHRRPHPGQRPRVRWSDPPAGARSLTIDKKEWLAKASHTDLIGAWEAALRQRPHDRFADAAAARIADRLRQVHPGADAASTAYSAAAPLLGHHEAFARAEQQLDQSPPSDVIDGQVVTDDVPGRPPKQPSRSHRTRTTAPHMQPGADDDLAAAAAAADDRAR